MATPLFPYPGGKSKMLSAILPLIPPHKTYVEPFAGGLAVLLAKERVKCEVVNDLDKSIVLFYRYVRMHADALFAELEARLAARSDFAFSRDIEPATELEQCIEFFFKQLLSFGGVGDCFSRRKDKPPHFNIETIHARILAARERLQRVYIECRDASEVMHFWDSSDTFIFLDPPYVCAKPSKYAAFTRLEMESLRDSISNLKGMWLLTCDDSDVCRDIFKDFRTQTADNAYSLGAGTFRQVKELLVFSDNFPAERLAA